jgi:GNAT superfamily N-acetyltransferase
MSGAVTIHRLSPAAARERVPELAAILVDCVEGGASVGFMAPLGQERAERFWRGVAAGVKAETRVLFGAAEAGSGRLVGTVQLVWPESENQPHRADIAKMLVHRAARRRGIADLLMAAAEAAALELGRTLLVLDTASPEAERLYERRGWTRLGVIPGFALWPDGRPSPTTFYYKELRPRGSADG